MINPHIKHAIMTGTALVLTGCTLSITDSPTKPEPCREIPFASIEHHLLPPDTLSYTAMDWGYGQWSFHTADAPDDEQILGYASQEDSLIYNHLECIYSQPEYPAT